MEAIAHNPAFAKKVGVSQKVGQEYSKADKGKTFRKGGIMAKKDMHSEKSEMKMDKEQDKAMIKKAFKQHDLQEHKGGKGTSLKLKKGGMSAGCGYDAGGKVKKFAMGGYMGGATLPNQQFPMQQQAPQNTMLNAPQTPQAPGTPGMPYATNNQTAFKKGGTVKKMAMGGMSTAMIGNDEDGGSAGRGNNGLPAKRKAVKKIRPYIESLTPEQINRANERYVQDDITYRGPAPVPGMPFRGLTESGMPSPYTEPMKKGGTVKKMAMGGPMDHRMAMMAKKKAPRGVAPAAAPRGMMPPKPPMAAPQVAPTMPMKKGGKVQGQSPIQRQAKGGAKIVKMAKGGMTRGDGCCIRGKTRA